MTDTGPLIEDDVIAKVLEAASGRDVEFAEVFAEDRRSSSAVLDDAKVEELTSGRDRGAGIRVVVGNSTGFAHTSDLSEAGLLATAEIAAAAARGGGGALAPRELRRVDAARPNAIEVLPGDVDKARKVELLGRADAAARAAGSSISQVTAPCWGASLRRRGRPGRPARSSRAETPEPRHPEH